MAAVLASGCAIKGRRAKISNAMDSWKGSHVSKVIEKWGPYDRVTSDGKGGSVYSYYFDRKTALTGTPYVAERHFYVNDEGIVYS